MRATLGGATALVATAHKLARVVYAIITTHRLYHPELHTQAEQRRRIRSLLAFRIAG